MKRLLGIDYGTARIGLSISDELQMLAHPLETLPATSISAALSRIAGIVQEREVERVVIGLPRNMDGSSGKSANEAEAFAEKLRASLPVEVVMWDERLSSVAAHRAVRDSGRKTRDARKFIDQIAAQIILQGYLDLLAAKAAGDRLPAD